MVFVLIFNGYYAQIYLLDMPERLVEVRAMPKFIYLICLKDWQGLCPTLGD
jgi:hypothetical protein